MRSLGVVVSVAWFAGCGYPRLAALGPVDGAVAGDIADSDAPPIDAPDGAVGLDGSADAPTCFGSSLVHVCLAAAPSAPLTISMPTIIDTAQPSACAQLTTSSTLCVVAATSIMVQSTLRATGPRPLVLVASDAITIAPGGLVDVASRRGVTPEVGAGADFAGCGSGVPPTAGSIAGGGGAGGSFIGKGGSGSNGVGGVGGSAGAVATAVTELRGGCPGQAGSSGGSNTTGHGGGAVYLIAGRTIDVQGGIDAAGEAGDGGNPGPTGPMPFASGGGGAGSGGMIGLDAPAIGSTGLILASGGGGGGGAGSRMGYLGVDGEQPSSTIAAGGGDGARNSFGTRVGGIGGRGSSVASGAGDAIAGTDDSVDVGGGAGGGGGAGIIKAPVGASLGPNVSPTPTP